MKEHDGFTEGGRCGHCLRIPGECADLGRVPMGLLLRHAEHVHDMKVREKIDTCGIPRAFGPVLMAISKNEGLTQAEIAQKMNFAAATVSVTIQKMFDAGYITRAPDNTDNRQIRISLTDTGREKTEEMRRLFGFLEDELVKTLTEDEKKELRRLLIKITEKV